MKVEILLLIIVLLFLLHIVLSSAANGGIVTINLSTIKPWWNDSVMTNGTASYSNGNPISDGSVSIRLNSREYCKTNTLSNGNYNCTFKAPLELGSYTLLVDVTNSTGSSFTNTTTLTLQIKYGEMPIGTIDRVVYEQPMLIQELSGRIRIVWARIMVWRG